MFKRLLLLTCLAGPILVAGCGKSSVWDRIPLSGTAQLDGNPFRDGSICFRPTRGTKGPSTIAKVRDGKFKFDKRNGPVPGAHSAILISKTDLSNRTEYRIDTKTTVPSAAPFTVALTFTTPEIEPESLGRRNELEEGVTPK